jgi:hypothetical protein
MGGKYRRQQKRVVFFHYFLANIEKDHDGYAFYDRPDDKSDIFYGLVYGIYEKIQNVRRDYYEKIVKSRPVKRASKWNIASGNNVIR